MSEELCCELMAYHLSQTCEVHADPFECPDAVIVRGQDAGYGLPIHDGGRGAIAISFCPWCGTRLKDVVPQGEFD